MTEQAVGEMENQSEMFGACFHGFFVVVLGLLSIHLWWINTWIEPKQKVISIITQLDDGG